MLVMLLTKKNKCEGLLFALLYRKSMLCPNFIFRRLIADVFLARRMKGVMKNSRIVLALLVLLEMNA
jgi:hypothetical protein